MPSSQQLSSAPPLMRAFTFPSSPYAQVPATKQLCSLARARGPPAPNTPAGSVTTRGSRHTYHATPITAAHLAALPSSAGVVEQRDGARQTPLDVLRLAQRERRAPPSADACVQVLQAAGARERPW